MAVAKKKISPKIKRILFGALGVFIFNMVFFLWLITHYRIASEFVVLIFLLYGALYALWFWLCVQIAYKFKNLTLGIILFFGTICIVFGTVRVLLEKSLI